MTNKTIKKYLMSIGISLLVIRLVLLITIELALRYEIIPMSIFQDNLHHYHLGLFLLLVLLPIYIFKKTWFVYIFSFAIALIIEEFIVIVYEIISPFGYNVPYTYLSIIDNILITTIALILIALSKYEEIRKYLFEVR